MRTSVVSLVTVLLISGCVPSNQGGDPPDAIAVKEFEEIVREVQGRIDKDPVSTWVITSDLDPNAPTYGKWGKCKRIYSDVRYDVQKTDSLVVPYAGTIWVKCTEHSYNVEKSGKHPSLNFATEREARALTEYWEGTCDIHREYSVSKRTMVSDRQRE